MISSEVNCCCCACGCAQVRYLVDVWGADVHARGDEALRVASRCADAVAVLPGSNSGNNGNSSSCNGRCLVSMLPQAGGSAGGCSCVAVSDRGERCGSSSSSDGGGNGGASGSSGCSRASACLWCLHLLMSAPLPACPACLPACLPCLPPSPASLPACPSSLLLPASGVRLPAPEVRLCFLPVPS